MQELPPTKPTTAPTRPSGLLRPTNPLLASPEIIPTTPIGHVWAFLGVAIGFYIAYTSWVGSAPSDDWARRWVLIAIPCTTTVGLLIGWRSAWQSITISMMSIYLFAPFVAARVESCLLPIPAAVPCFADNTIVLDVASQLAHPIYYPVLIGLHLAGAFFVWSFVASNGGHYHDATPSPSPTTD